MKRLGWSAITLVGVPLAGVVFLQCVGDNAEIGSVDPDSATAVPDSAGGSDGPVVDPVSCAARTATEAKAIFVNINGADSPQCGTAIAPCQTVQAGIDQAKVLSRSIVFVARGTYKESVKLIAGTTLEGGWDTLVGKWIPVCGTETVTAVKLQMPDDASVVAKADFAGDATMRYLSILGKPTAAAGESVYGVFAKGATITFEAVSVSIGNAGAGGAGAGGMTGGAGGLKCPTGNAAAGTAGTAGGGADGGTIGPDGYTPSDGTIGQADGTRGLNGTCTAACGGNERTICISNTANCSASNGCVNPLAGCGGSPGSGGGGGGGGGSCFAIFGWDATFNVSGGAFISGNAGRGGSGGKGGEGGAGGSGATEQEICASCVNGVNCATVGNQALATGGAGGAGGVGGAGGGGAGGSSYGIYAGGPHGKLNVTNAPLYQSGAPGASGSPNGSAGGAGDTFP